MHQGITGGTEQHAREAAAPTAADHDELRLLGEFTEDTHRTIPRDDAFDRDVGIPLLEAGEPLGKYYLFPGLDTPHKGSSGLAPSEG